MYSSLDRVDIVARTRDGVRKYVQTDHRSPSEMEGGGDMSVFFALCRVLNAVRVAVAEGGAFKVVYALAAAGELPPALHRAIASAGASVETPQGELPYRGGTADVDALADEVLARIASAVSAERGARPTLEGVRALERELSGSPPPGRDEDEGLFWTAVARTGAFAGEAMRRLKGGRWVRDGSGLGMLPIVFECEGLKLNFLGKAVKFLELGEGDRVSDMIEVACRMADENAGRAPRRVTAFGAGGGKWTGAPGEQGRKKGLGARLFGGK